MPTRLKTLTLNCPNCNGNLEITPETSAFTCVYCGAGQAVERAGAEVTLKLFAGGAPKFISKVREEKEAPAESLIEKLEDEFRRKEQTMIQSQIKHDALIRELSKPFKIIGAILPFILLFGLIVGGSTAIIFGIGFLIAAGALVYVYSIVVGRRKAARIKDRKILYLESNKILAQIEKHGRVAASK